MADLKAAGEQANRMIEEQNRLRSEAAAAMAANAIAELENQPSADDAIPDAIEGEAGNQTDVGVQATNSTVSDSEITLLRKEVEAANQRWKVLQGMVDKKDAEVDNMRALLSQLSQKAETSKAESHVPLVSSQDEEDYGADVVDLGRRIAAEVFDQRIRAVMDRMAKLEQSINGVGEMTAKVSADSFDDALTRKVSDWRAVNVDPAFIAWLQEEEGFAGKTKLELLTDAYTTGNLARTAKFFEAFKTATEQVTAPAQAEPKKDNVTKLISPGKARSSVTPQVSQDSKQVWSTADISRLYEDKRNGRITQDEFNTYERDLFKAQGEGRIAA